MNGYGAHNLDWVPGRRGRRQRRRPRTRSRSRRRRSASLKLTSFPALLEELFLTQLHSLVVAGTHGKTTTSSLAAFVLTDAGRDPSFLVGGVPVNFGRSWRLGKGDAVRRRGRRVRHRLLRQGLQVPALPPEDGNRHQRRARPRRHLRLARRHQGGVPQVRRADPRRRAAASSPPIRRARSTWPGAPAARSRRTSCATPSIPTRRPTGSRAPSPCAPAAARCSRSRTAASPSASSTPGCPAATTWPTRWR